jgi:hypothetical protein
MIRNANNITEEWKNLNRNRAKNKKFKEENNMDEIRAKLAEMREKRKTKVSVESLFTKTFLQ